jgi:hypothetical protein
MLALAGLAVFWVIRRRPAESPLRGRSAQIGAVCALLLVFASAGSAISDRYMPEAPSETTPSGPGILAWTAHQAQRASKAKVFKPRVMLWERAPGLPVPPAVPMP